MKFAALTAVTLAAALAAAPALAQSSQTAQPGKTAPGNMAALPGNNGGGTSNPTAAGSMPAKPMETANTATTMGTASNAEIGTATVNTKSNNNNAADMNAAKNANTNALPHQRNPVLADNGQPRASKIIGSDVYNMQDQQVGSVDDVLMGVNGQPDQAVLSVKNKLRLVPFSELIFGNTKVNGDNRVILPDKTRDALAGMPEFHYNNQNKS